MTQYEVQREAVIPADIERVHTLINSFHQWAVALGQQLALQIAPALEGAESAIAAQDASTRALLASSSAPRA